MSILKIDDSYLAHISTDNKKSETLKEHLDLTLEYAKKIIEINNIDITKLPISEELLLDSIYFHDFGKINENFQLKKMKNAKFSQVANNLGSKHSNLSYYLFLAYTLSKVSKIEDRESRINQTLDSIIFGYPILKHHSSNLKNIKLDINNFENLDRYLDMLEVDSDSIKDALTKIGTFINRIDIDGSFEKFITIKLIYSLLSSSDYIATYNFMNRKEITDFRVIDDRLRAKIIKNFEKSEFIQKIESKKDELKDLSEIQNISNENLNLLRSKLFLEIRESIRANLDKNLFYIEAPTGSGKTNLSILCSVELLKSDSKLNKIFYVFPFTRIIEQVYETLKERLNLKSSEIVKIHSKTEFNNFDDDEYADKRDPKIDNLFTLSPITLLSHINLFGAMMGNRKKSNYLLHRFANSIIVIDEVQSYPIDFWDKMSYFIDEMAKLFNIRFVLMSATLPKIENLLIEPKNRFTNLVNDRDFYFKNPNFANRVKFDLSLLNQKMNYESLFDLVNARSEKKVLVSFITKKMANDFYKIAKNNSSFDKVLLLNGSILEFKQKEIIDTIKDSDKKILLITTQVIEAGVDIDMDIGFKHISILDSDEQLAGRINRNSEKQKAKLFLFKIESPSIVYKDFRVKLSQKFYDNRESNRDYNDFYNDVIENIKESRSDLIRDFDTYCNDISMLNFESIAKESKIIDMDSISLFIPVKIPRKNFSDSELEILSDGAKNLIEIDGSKVWQEFKSADRDKIFNLNSIISKFTISLPTNPTISKKISSNFATDEYGGFIYIQNYQKIYSIESGLDFETIKISEFENQIW